jgi:hypothetical protein
MEDGSEELDVPEELETRVKRNVLFSRVSLAGRMARPYLVSLISLISFVSLTFGCTRGVSEEGERTDPTVSAFGIEQKGPLSIRSAKVMPNPIVLDRPVSVEVAGIDDDDNSVSLHYQWIVNGIRVQGQTGPTLDQRLLRRGDHVTVEVIPVSSGHVGPPYQSPDILVANTPPVMGGVKLEPISVHKGDRLRAKAEATDADHDPIVYVYRWWRNQRFEQETEVAELATDQFSRGDIIVVEVIPSDGHDHGKPLASEPLVLANSPPRITSTPSLTISPDQYQYGVLATDLDGDFLNFSLQQGPPGMAIDKTTGQLVWHRPGTAKGPQRVRIIVDDGHQGEAFQEFELNVTLTTAAQ